MSQEVPRLQAIEAMAALLLVFKCDRCDQPTDDYTVFSLPDTGRTELCAECAAQQEGQANGA